MYTLALAQYSHLCGAVLYVLLICPWYLNQAIASSVVEYLKKKKTKRTHTNKTHTYILPQWLFSKDILLAEGRRWKMALMKGLT